MSESELRGVARSLRETVPSLVSLNRSGIGLLDQGRALASCTNNVLTPFSRSPIPSAEPGNSGHEVRRQVFRGLVGLAGESRNNDANTPYFHIQTVKPSNLAAANGGRLEPLSPPNPNVPPVHRPDVPCETQEPPNLDAPDGPGLAPAGATAASVSAARRGSERLLASPLLRDRVESFFGGGEGE
jgi:phospholipid/cholesterol/gamma-HCH transport system substrate-binding protein